jgi:hypothetical protein
MGTLSGQRVKDAYPSLLKLESGTATSTTKVIEDGAGNDTALKLSTTKVEVNGTLGFTSAPTTGSTEVTALFLDASNNVIKRNLGTAAFTSGASLTPVAPLNIVSNTISISAPTTLSQLTSATAASADSFLIYDATGTAYKYITLNDLTDYISSNTDIAAPGSNTQVIFNNGGSFGAAAALNYSPTLGAEQLTFGGRYLAQREEASGTAGYFYRNFSKTVANAAVNDIVAGVEAANFKSWQVDYVIYGSGESIKRMGTLHVVWNSTNLSTSPVLVDTIHVSLGTSTTSTFVFNANISVSTIRVRATNTTGENMVVLVNSKLFYAY